MLKQLQTTYANLPGFVKTPYFIAGLLFAVWMIFFDENNLVSQYKRYDTLSTLLEKKEYYEQQIEKTNKEYNELTTNAATQEKFAREHYRMKRDNEDVFVIVTAK